MEQVQAYAKANDLDPSDRVAVAAHSPSELQATVTYRPPPGIVWDDQTYSGDAYPVFGWACCVVDVAVDTVDKYLTWGEPPAQVAEKIAKVKAAAAKKSRKLTFGIRLHVIVRETNEAAWRAADELIRYVTDDTIAAAQKIFSRMDSVGQQRMAQLHGGRRDKLEISPNLWAGVGLVRGGAGTALVGDPQTVAARIKEYQDAGVDTFIMSGYPHLEEAYRFAELVFPLLNLNQSNVAHLRVNTGPFGETIGNDFRPQKQASSS